MINIAAPQIGPEEMQAVTQVLESGILAQGPRVRAFEEAFAEMCTVRYAIATSSGTTALQTTLLAHGIGPGDEVITSPFTFIASANSMLFTGARPVFIDIDPFTFNIDPSLIEAAITPHTKALMPVHLYGLACDMEPILDIARRHDLLVIEDACQSHCAVYKDQPVGSFGSGCFSLYPTKNITAGEGGMITTSDKTFAEKCHMIRNHGMASRDEQDILGFNFRMTDIHAAIGLEQLKKLEGFNRSRQANAHYLIQNLQGVIVPFVPRDCQHVFNQFTVRVPDGRRDELKQHLSDHGIGSMIYYPLPVYRQSYYIEQQGYDLHLPNAERAAVEVLSLPVHPGLSEGDLKKIVSSVNSFFTEYVL